MSALVATATSATPWMETEKNCDTVKLRFSQTSKLQYAQKGTCKTKLIEACQWERNIQKVP